ncbi:MAG: hypothetical protein EOM20_16330 [Spartobacteria bacterium]|nr:hypothetical protein [Spartobacteria bacterium]
MSDRKANVVFFGLGLLLLALLCAGCETSSDTPSGMSNGDVSVNMDFSGAYIGAYSGNRVVESKSQPAGDSCTTNYTITSEIIETNDTIIILTRTNESVVCTQGSDINANFTTLNLSVSGKSVSLRDNNGSGYQGSIGDYIYDEPSGGIQAGETIIETQLNFSGFDQGSQRTIDFAGTLKAVALREISGETSISKDDGSQNSGISASHDFSLTAQNAQYVLEGRWQEHGGRSSNARATAPASGGSISMQTTFSSNQNSDTNRNDSTN